MGGRSAKTARWATAAMLLGLMVALPTVTEARGREIVVTCPGVQPPDGYDQDPAAPSIPAVQGDAVAYRTAGAEVSIDGNDIGSPQASLTLTVTYQGVRRQLTTQGNDLGSNYPNRSPGPGDTDYGLVTITTGTHTWLTLFRADSGLVTMFAWRLDRTCGAEPTVEAPATTVAPGSATPAEAVSGTASFTG